MEVESGMFPQYSFPVYCFNVLYSHGDLKYGINDDLLLFLKYQVFNDDIMVSLARGRITTYVCRFKDLKFEMNKIFKMDDNIAMNQVLCSEHVLSDDIVDREDVISMLGTLYHSHSLNCILIPYSLKYVVDQDASLKMNNNVAYTLARYVEFIYGCHDVVDVDVCNLNIMNDLKSDP